MYDPPSMRAANDAFWAAIRQDLGYGPDALVRGKDLWAIWQSPDLLLAQTCALPWRARLDGAVTLVGAPDFALPGCPPGTYNSVLIARQDDDRPLSALLTARIAVNDPLSQSGYATLWTRAEAEGLALAPVMITGAHAASAQAVAAGYADLAAIDAQTWRLIVQDDPGMADALRVIERTPPTPALPYITAPGRDGDALRTAMNAALGDMPQDLRARLCLRAILPANAAAMRAQPIPPTPAVAPCA